MNTNKKAILVVSFGTSYKETREKTIDAIENEIKIPFLIILSIEPLQVI